MVKVEKYDLSTVIKVNINSDKSQVARPLYDVMKITLFSVISPPNLQLQSNHTPQHTDKQIRQIPFERHYLK